MPLNMAPDSGDDEIGVGDADGLEGCRQAS